MKISHIAAAAGLVLASLGVATAADAQPHRGDRYEMRHDRGRHWNQHRWGHGNRWHNRCHTEWRHHHRVRVCG